MPDNSQKFTTLVYDNIKRHSTVQLFMRNTVTAFEYSLYKFITKNITLKMTIMAFSTMSAYLLLTRRIRYSQPKVEHWSNFGSMLVCKPA